MPSVEFEHGAYIHDADELTSFVAVSRRGPSHDRAPRGDVEVSAAGTRQWSQSPGVTESFAVSTRTRDKTTVDFLVGRDGDLVLYRDRRSRLEWAVIQSVQVQDLDGAVYDITLTVVPVDHDPLPVQV